MCSISHLVVLCYITKASMPDLQDEYSCDFDVKNDLIDLRDRYSREGRSQHTLNMLRRLQ